jgi:hypothetical protein
VAVETKEALKESAKRMTFWRQWGSGDSADEAKNPKQRMLRNPHAEQSAC